MKNTLTFLITSGEGFFMPGNSNKNINHPPQPLPSREGRLWENFIQRERFFLFFPLPLRERVRVRGI